MSYSIDQFETESHSEIVQGRLKEVCPPTLLAEMDADNSTAVWLWEYIYDVWRCDN
jgi:hypothetical protein